MFTRQDDGTLERLALGGHEPGWRSSRSTAPRARRRRGERGELWGDEQWRLLREIVADRDPENIVLNIDDKWAFADGLGAGEAEALLDGRSVTKYAERVKREPRLAMDYISVRVPEMMPRYRQIEETVACAHLRGVLELRHHAGRDHHRGRGLVAASEGAGPGRYHVVPAFGGRAARG